MSMSSPLPLGCNHHFHKRSFATLQQQLAHTKYLLIGEVMSNDVAITNISRETNNHTDSEECVRSLHTTDEGSKIETESEARIARQALDRKKREEKRRKKGDDESRII